MGNDKRIGTYICRGCDIGSSLDVEALGKVAGDEFSVETCRDHPCLCGAEGLEIIENK